MTAPSKQNHYTMPEYNRESIIAKSSAADRLSAYGINTILEQIINGEFFQDIADMAGVSRTSMTKWLELEHKDDYACAREERYHRLAEQVIEIADDSNGDIRKDENGIERTDTEVVARSRLRVDARKWYVAKMLPRQYGDKTDIALTGADGGAIKVETLSDEEIGRKLYMALAIAASKIPDETDKKQEAS